MAKHTGTFVNSFVQGLSGPINASNATSPDRRLNRVIDNPNTSAEVRESLKSLYHLVESTRDELGENRTAQIEKDVETLAEELSSPAPRSRWFALTLHGIVD